MKVFLECFVADGGCLRPLQQYWLKSRSLGDTRRECFSEHSMCVQALEEVKLREMAIIDLQKKIGEAENKFKQQQNLYEAVRVDRNMYSKKLIESQDETQEMKRKFKIMNHQIEQLKDEISAKDMALVKEHFDHLRVRLVKYLLFAHNARKSNVRLQQGQGFGRLSAGSYSSIRSEDVCIRDRL
jgi:hypothetical protein